MSLESDINTIAKQKINEISSACQQAIYAGIDVALSTGTKHFSLDMHDQVNIDSMASFVILGASEYPYHADGEACEMYSSTDIMKLYVAYKTFVTQQTTYNNLMKIYINRLTDKDTIAAISYGSMLPDDLLAEARVLMKESQEQVQAIISSIGKNTSTAS